MYSFPLHFKLDQLNNFLESMSWMCVSVCVLKKARTFRIDEWKSIYVLYIVFFTYSTSISENSFVCIIQCLRSRKSEFQLIETTMKGIRDTGAFYLFSCMEYIAKTCTVLCYLAQVIYFISSLYTSSSRSKIVFCLVILLCSFTRSANISWIIAAIVLKKNLL